MSLITLAYVSSAVKPLSRQELTELLAHCRQSNTAAGISGLLLYKGGNFLQVLEGEAAAVLDLKTRIARDLRHSGMIVMFVRPIEKRQFGEWAMAFHDLDSAELRDLPGYSDYVDTSLTAESIGGRLAPLLESFRRNMR